MPSIRFGGMSSGLPPNIVDQLIEAERLPIKNLETRKGKQENRLTLVNELEEKINGIKDPLGSLSSTKGFQDLKLESGDPNIVQGVADPGSAVSGSWNIEVMQLAQKASAVTNGFPDKDTTEIGTGYFSFDTADGTKEVYINGTNNTLQGAANAINKAGLGVRATVINDRSSTDLPYKLMISGDGVGDDHKIQYPTLYFLDGDMDLYFDEEREAKNGIVKVDGFELQIDDNTVKDIIPGVTLDIKQASPGRQVNVTIKEDREVVSGKISEFVKAINGVFDFIQSQNRLNESSDTTKTLGGDSLLRSIENRMRRLVQAPIYGVKGPINRLNQLGIEFTRNGNLKLDEEKFNSILAQNPDAVQSFFAGDGFNTGFVPKVKREIGTVLNVAFGVIPIRKRSLQNNIKRIDKSIDQKERQLSKKEQSLRRKFAKLEETMSRLKSQGGSLGAMGGGGAMPNFGGAKIG